MVPAAALAARQRFDPEPPVDHHHSVTDATKQLSKALQELTACSPPHTALPASIPADGLVIAREIERFLEEKQCYAEKTHGVSVGRY